MGLESLVDFLIISPTEGVKLKDAQIYLGGNLSEERILQMLKKDNGNKFCFTNDGKTVLISLAFTLPEYNTIKSSAIVWRDGIYEYLCKLPIGEEIELSIIPTIVNRPVKLLKRIRIMDVLITDGQRRFVIIHPKPPFANLVRVKLSSKHIIVSNVSGAKVVDEASDVDSYDTALEKWKLEMIAFLEGKTNVTTNILGSQLFVLFCVIFYLCISTILLITIQSKFYIHFIVYLQYILNV
jgi:hypothetical protein